jgi:hypothetical protein
MNKLLLTPLFAIAFLTGCARYEFEMIEPAPALHVGERDERIIKIDPLEYHLRAVEGRLVMQIFNPTDDPITLLGDRTYVIAPSGQSHPVRGQTIAQHSFIKLILPPMRPYYREDGPHFAIGVGIGRAYGPWPYHGYPYYYNSYYYDEPRYIAYYDPADATYWNWPAEWNATVHLQFQRDTATFAQEFVFQRQREK